MATAFRFFSLPLFGFYWEYPYYVVQWRNTCLAYIRVWVPPLALRRMKRGGKEGRKRGERHIMKWSPLFHSSPGSTALPCNTDQSNRYLLFGSGPSMVVAHSALDSNSHPWFWWRKQFKPLPDQKVKNPWPIQANQTSLPGFYTVSRPRTHQQQGPGLLCWSLMLSWCLAMNIQGMHVEWITQKAVHLQQMLN